MAANIYHFEDRWFVPFPVETVWEVLSKPTTFPLWWKQVYLKAEKLDSERIAVLTKGWLPYKLRWTIQTIHLDKPVVKLLSPVLKPVFEWNHHWAMNLGEKQLAEYLQTQSRVR